MGVHDELARAVVSVPVASLLGMSFAASLRGRSTAVIVGGVVVLLGLSDDLSTWRPWAVAAVTAASAALMPGRGWRAKSRWGTVMRVPALALGATVLAAVITDRSASEDAVRVVTEQRGVVIIVAGGLAAVFVGGEVIARILHPLAEATAHVPAGMENAGRYIGWLERTLLYTMFLAGAPDAAALVIAGKSIARFPSFAEESFAEYYLIGSLLSLVISAGLAIAVRALLGATPLLASRL
jgi:hypothetical protein